MVGTLISLVIAAPHLFDGISKIAETLRRNRELSDQEWGVWTEFAEERMKQPHWQPDQQG